MTGPVPARIVPMVAEGGRQRGRSDSLSHRRRPPSGRLAGAPHRGRHGRLR